LDLTKKSGFLHVKALMLETIRLFIETSKELFMTALEIYLAFRNGFNLVRLKYEEFDFTSNVSENKLREIFLGHITNENTQKYILKNVAPKIANNTEKPYFSMAIVIPEVWADDDTESRSVNVPLRYEPEVPDVRAFCNEKVDLVVFS
jgi:hypothetical protein